MSLRRRIGACLAACALAGGTFVALTRPAGADPWVPAAGDGTIKPMVRLFEGDRSFPAGGFTTNTVPASTENATQYRVTGVAGLGDGWSLEYDLRGGRVRSFTDHHHRKLARISSGLQDEEIGLNRALVQTPGFADSLAFNIVIPAGRTKPSPSLGTGRWAVEPDFQAGIARPWGSLSLVAGPRVFLDGAATQLRATGYASFRVTRRISLLGEVFFVRTVGRSGTLPPGARGELYDLLRFGAGAEYRLTRTFRPFFLYQVNVAGEGIHAGRRLELGIAIHY